VTLVAPRDINSDWGSIENVIQKDRVSANNYFNKKDKTEEVDRDEKPLEKNTEPDQHSSIIDEWAPDFEELKKELNQPEE